jgi:hypothetical protein
MPRYFSIEEAQDRLDEIRPLVAEIMRIHGAILEKRPEAWPAIQQAAGNGGSLAASLLVPEFELLRQLVHKIQDDGIIIKDMSVGLVDFPCLRDGREVYLCWRYGEDRIAFWHEIDAGFAGRQPLSAWL